MKKRITMGILCFLAIGLLLSILLGVETNKLCDQLQEIRSGQREGFSMVFPLGFHERFLLTIAGNRENPRSIYALNILGGMKSARGRLITERYLTSDVPRVRAIAVECLAYYSDNEMRRSFLDLLKSEEDLIVYAMAGTHLTGSIERVDLEELESMINSTTSTVKKCILAGLILAKEQNSEREDVYEEFKSKVEEEDSSHIGFFEMYLTDVLDESELDQDSFPSK